MLRSRPLKRAHPLRSASRFVTAAYCVVLLLVLLIAAPALAAVEGGPHDVIAQGYDVTRTSILQERCTRCHVSSSPELKDFLPAVPPVLSSAYGASSLACFSCHDGTTIVSPAVDASRTAFHPASHGNDLTGYEGLRSEAVGLPYLDGKRMECVTCHDPHDNGHRPLLRAGIGEICLICHSTRSEGALGEQNTSGNHPQGANPAKLVRKEVPLKVAAAFTTPFPAPYPLAGGRASVGTHWDLGGHLSAGGTGTIVCVTCHAVHGNEQAPPPPGLLTVDPVRLEADLFCEGCHAGVRGDDQEAPPHPNPGGTETGRTYHPADNDRANGEGSIIETRKPAGWPLGAAVSSPILCSTCHRAHGATERTQLLRRPPVDQGFCEVCHERMPLQEHHPLIEKDGGGCSNQIVLKDPVTGIRRTCELCHRAHNAGLGAKLEADFVPLLREGRLSDASCLRCHPAGNPTCGNTTLSLAGHFVGDPTLSETYADSAPPYRLTPWSESKLLSLYGGEKGQVLICLSCHTFRPGAIVSGDAGKTGHLLARSGNPVEWGDDPGVYLCTGCHGVSPGTGKGEKGHTHPLMNARAESLTSPAEPPVTTTASGRVNCDSCHRPHEARTEGGYYILEKIDSPNRDPRAIHPPIDFTTLCFTCHPPLKY